MAARPDNPPVIAIVGETASGKSSLAMELAQQFNGEIICADSRTIYKGMDIGTAKPSAEDRALVPHHVLDVVTPDQAFSAAAFKSQAEAAINDITSRGKIPFLVGGTGLYVDAVMYDFTFRAPADPTLRASLELKSVEELQALLVGRGILLPKNARNPRHLTRALETNGEQSVRLPLRPNSIILGTSVEREALKSQIALRVDAMMQSGLLDEVRAISDQYGWAAPAMQSPGYKEFQAYFSGEVNLEQVKAFIVQGHIRLAKRQRTWFRRNPDIRYICKKAEAVEMITTLLNNSYTASD